MKKTKSEYIKIKNSKIHGKGIFAKKDIPKNTKIIEYIGKKITKKQADKIYQNSLEKSEKKEKQITTYLFELNKKYDIEGNIQWNTARLINHSCNPNCEAVNENGHIWIYSIKNIKKGREISYDYGFPFEDYEDHPCKCNTEECPGYIVPKRKRKKLKEKLENQKPKTVLLGLSGGVDSAVSALLLKKQGYEVIGAFIKSFSRKNSKIKGNCLWKEDIKYAKKIAKKLNIFLIKFNFENEYLKDVIEPMFKDYKKGLTPNPDALCNKKVKFPLLWKEAQKLGADYIATGHYIKKIQNPDKSYSIKIPKDKNKDQSYFLYDLTQFDLKHSLFPIGDAELTKDEVRKIAKKNNFLNYDKPGTRGLCFIGKMNMKSFLRQKIKRKPGKIINTKKEIIGKHDGTMYYTIGERAINNENFKVNKEYRKKTKSKLYIIKKNSKKNTITLAPKGHPDSFRKKFQLKKTNFINPIKFPLNKIKVRIRHLGKLYPAKITKKNKKILVKLKKPIENIAEGQSCVIYQGSKILGGGEIKY